MSGGICFVILINMVKLISILFQNLFFFCTFFIVIFVVLIDLVSDGAALPVLIGIPVDEGSKVGRDVEVAESDRFRQRGLIPSA